jgi:hypothetical protein
MLKKSLIAAAAVAAAFTVAAPVEQASAKTNIDIHLGFGGWGPGYGYGYGYYPVHRPYRPHWGVSCFTGKRIVRNHGFRNIHAVDCSRPVYQYRAWKFGNPYRVKVGVGGNILSVRPL